MVELESENVIVTSKDTQLEDVTSLLFGALEHLKDCELLAKPNFDLNETMSSFEAMDLKMDIRMGRKQSLIPSKAIE